MIDFTTIPIGTAVFDYIRGLDGFIKSVNGNGDVLDDDYPIIVEYPMFGYVRYTNFGKEDKLHKNPVLFFEKFLPPEQKRYQVNFETLEGMFVLITHGFNHFITGKVIRCDLTKKEFYVLPTSEDEQIRCKFDDFIIGGENVPMIRILKETNYWQINP